MAAIMIALDQLYTLLSLPTNSGITFVIGIVSQYLRNKKKTVIVVVPNEELKS